MSKSKAEIIQETIDWYAADPDGRRATQEGGECMYSTADGRCCAVGRVLKDPRNAEEDYGGCAVNDIPEDLFQEEYKGHEYKFWNILQGMHDDGINWVSTGLSSDGIGKLIDLANRFEIEHSMIRIPGTDKTLEDYA